MSDFNPVVTTKEEAVAVLSDIGARRRKVREEDDQLRKDTKVALRAANGFVSRSLAARLAALNRSTIYELYLGEDEGDDESRDNREPATGE